MREDSKTVQKGYFEDSQVKDRKQQIMVVIGNQFIIHTCKMETLDPGLWIINKIKSNHDCCWVKAILYQGLPNRDIERIKIDKWFNGVLSTALASKKYTYKYVGTFLTYKKGNRGVRYLFEAKESDARDFKCVQFSNHEITPVKAAHFHFPWRKGVRSALWWVGKLANFYPSTYLV